MRKANVPREESAVREAISNLLAQVPCRIPKELVQDVVLELLHEPNEWGLFFRGGEIPDDIETGELLCAILDDRVLIAINKVDAEETFADPRYEFTDAEDIVKIICTYAEIDDYARKKCARLGIKTPKHRIKQVLFVDDTRTALASCSTKRRDTAYICTVYKCWEDRSLAYMPYLSRHLVINKIAEILKIPPVVAKRIACGQISQDEFEMEMAMTKLGR